MIPLLLITIVTVGLITFLINTYNRLVMLKNNSQKAFSNIDVVLKQRADEVPNLVRTVKATALNENTILKELVMLRSQYFSTHESKEKMKIASHMDGKLKSFMITVESYPEIKSSQSFLELQKRLSELEDIIADRREYFNDSINLYNTGIEVFPDFIFAKMMNYQKMEMLQFSESEKQYNNITF
ncbi:LemA family protein [Chryseobacterium vrystaatense]|uniref:Membrane protein n=1 Tax=Chryseobacterium vrystaatense TaxID=307480 RepID=A0ABR4UHG1_9FLAO|nr:LemA family protein [Chryseobacterium vrystaatense]KFF24051.1 membrane protein [Chryseobacterium vrystaatense]